MKTSQWKEIALFWSKLKPPLRPSKGEIKIYQKFIQEVLHFSKTKHPQILLLGATPELRESLAKLNYFLTLIDINPLMIKAMTSLLKVKRRKEKIIVDDWLKFNLKEKFDLILGDHIFSNIPYSKYPKLFLNIKRHLKEEGFFITNIHLKVFFKNFNLEKFLKKYFKEKWRGKDKWFYLYQMMYNDPAFYSFKNFRLIWPSQEKVLKEAQKRKINLSSKEAAKICDYISLKKEAVFTLPPRNIFEKEFKKYFKIWKKDYDRSHPVFRSHIIYLAALK